MTEERIPTSVVPHLHYPFEWFNPAQSLVVPHKDEDVNIVCAFSTGAGKTVAAELVMDSVLQKGKKVIYTSPLKALSQEKYDDWTSPKHAFSKYRVSILTGDYRLTETRVKELREANIIILTSEMMDSRCKRMEAERNDWLIDVGLAVIDECFPYDTRITLADGSKIPIGKIVDHKLPVEVLSFNHVTGQFEKRRVTGWHRKQSVKRLVRVTHEFGNFTCTCDHKVYTKDRGYLQAQILNQSDILEVPDEGPSIRTTTFDSANKNRKECHSGVSTGGRWPDASSNEEVSKVHNTTRFSRRESRVLEVSYVEETCWDTSQNTEKSRIQKRREVLGVCNSLLQRIYGSIQSYISKRKENGITALAPDDRQPSGYSSMVFRRWLSYTRRSCHDLYACFFGKRSPTSFALATSPMGHRGEVLFCEEKILDASPFQVRKRSVNDFSAKVCAENNAKEGSGETRKTLLSNVWSFVFGSAWDHSPRKTSNAVRKPVLQEKVEKNSVKSNGRKEEVFDLTVESNHNYFADGVLVHNCHLIGISDRGDALESGLMKFTSLNPNARIVFLSATVANSEEFAKWATFLNGKKSAHLRSAYRPCPLTKHYVDYPDKGKYADKEKANIKAAIEVLQENDKDHFIFFVHGKDFGEKFLKELQILGYSAKFHNADLDKEARLQVESDFRTGKLEHLVATSTLSWGVNLPARRVLVMGVHRGMKIVDPLDIIQEFGRAGRPGFDTEGDAYLLVPQSKALHFKTLVETEPTIKSQMLDVEVLAFHLITDIEKKEVRTLEDIQHWYERSFAKFQGESLKPNLVDEVVRRLEQIGAIKVVDGVYECQAIGKIAAWFYQSPFDVAQWKGNFERIFRRTKNPDEMDMAWAISHVDSYLQKTWLHKDDELKAVDLQREYWRRGYSYDKKATSIVYGLISHLKSKGIPTRGRGAIYQIVIDAERIVDTIKTVGSYTKAYDPDGKFWEVFSLRLQTGASKEMVPLVQLDGVGPKRAGLLLKENIKSPGDVMSSATKVKEVLGEKIGASVIEAANKLIRNPQARF